MAVGAVEWIEGRGLLIAELWAQHQGQVHLFPVTHLASDGPDLDLYVGDILQGTLIALTTDEISAYDFTKWKETLASDAWRRFWASQIDGVRRPPLPRTITHRVTWPDGATATVKITADHPNHAAPLSLSGQAARLGALPATEWPTVLEVMLSQLAARESATLATTAEGQWRDENDVL